MDKESFFWQVREGKIPPPRCAQTLGVEVQGFDSEEGTVEAIFEGREGFLNPAGNVQGGKPLARASAAAILRKMP